MTERLGRYELVEELGRGGMGVVWKAWDPQLRRHVALKRIRAEDGGDPEALERFVREARAAASLRHPHIVPVYDIGQQGDALFFVAELVEGVPLDQWARRPHTALGSAELVRLVAGALAHAHAHGVVHRDVKPGNILVDAEGRPHLVDFGLARQLDGAARRLTGADVLMGTPQYMSPEQAIGGARDVGPASDQFSLGAVLYELLTGVPPFAGDTLRELIVAISDRDPIPPTRRAPGVDRDLDTICLKALEKDPTRRYRDAGAFAEDLARYLAGAPIAARSPSPLRRLRKFARRHRSTALAALGAAGLAVGASAWLLAPGPSPPPPPATDLAAREKALSHVESARASLEQARRVLYRKSGTYVELRERSSAARAELERALELAPDLALARFLLAETYALESRRPEAEREVREAIRLDPELGPAHYLLGRLLLFRAWADSLGVTSEEQAANGRRSRPPADEGVRAMEHAVAAGVGGGDPLATLTARLFADSLHAAGPEDWQDWWKRLETARAAWGDRDGAEELHLLAGRFGDDGPAVDQAYDLALRIRPHFPEAGQSRACRRRAVGDLGGCLDDLADAVEFDPGLAPAWALIASARQARGELAEAALAMDRAIECWPGRASMHALRAEVRVDAGDPAGAVDDADRAIALDPTLWMGWFHRARARSLAGDHAAALADLDRAAELVPGALHVRIERGLERARAGDLPGAVAELREAIRLEPGSPAPFAALATVHEARGDVESALVSWSDALNRDTEDPEYWEARAEIHDRLGNLGAAVRDWEGAARLSPGDARRAGRLEAARARLREAASRPPIDAQGWLDRAFDLQAAGDADGAIEAYTRALELAPRLSEALDARGVLRQRKGDRDGAMADFDRAIEADPTSARAWTDRGRLHRERLEFDAAIADMRHALAIAPADWPYRPAIEQFLAEAERAAASD